MRTVGMLAAAALLLPVLQDPGAAPQGKAAAKDLEKAFLEHGIHLEIDRGLCSIPVTIDVRDDLLEYLLVNPQGAAHESLFLTEVVPSRLNAALLTLGVEHGKNADWKRKDPAPTPEEVRDGALPYVVEPPTGDGFLLYAAWREHGETFFFRVDDLLRNLETGRSLLRHRWVFLGSRMVRFRGRENEEVFAADAEGNLVNIAFFEQGNTLLTAARPECLKQAIWLANGWLLPGRGSPVELFFSREPLASLPAGIEGRLPTVPEEPDGAEDR